MKLGIIRCMQTEDYCPGTTDFKMIRERKGAFEGINEEIEIVGFCNCGGCPAKKAVLRARKLRKSAEIDPNTIKKPRCDEAVNLANPRRICCVLDCGLGDIMEYVDETKYEKVTSTLLIYIF